MHAHDGRQSVALALYQPDIPQNTGNILRLAACLGVPVHLIGPAGFDISDRAFRRSGMDYIAHAAIERHAGWTEFEASRRTSGRRLVLLTTRGDVAYVDFRFSPGDMLLLGRESAGVPDPVHASADARIVVPMRPGLRSLNVSSAAALVLGEALRQTGGFPGPAGRDDGGDG
jgi:tRNA (cytidine/uridine-2'-O-)-methyltransferase